MENSRRHDPPNYFGFRYLYFTGQVCGTLFGFVVGPSGRGEACRLGRTMEEDALRDPLSCRSDLYQQLDGRALAQPSTGAPGGARMSSLQGTEFDTRQPLIPEGQTLV